MWFGKGALPPTAFVWSVILHDLSVIATVAWFMLHVYLVAVHPIHRESITSMFEGTVTEEYAREHYGKWIAESLYRRRGAGN